MPRRNCLPGRDVYGAYLVLKVVVGAEALELAVDHDGESVAQRLALLHTAESVNSDCRPPHLWEVSTTLWPFLWIRWMICHRFRLGSHININSRVTLLKLIHRCDRLMPGHRIHPGAGLVQEDERRLPNERHRHVELALVTPAIGARLPLYVLLDTQELCPAGDLGRDLVATQ